MSETLNMKMKVCVCGLGYVGAVTATCLARLGHIVVGVDILESKVSAINAGHSHFVENGLAELASEMVAGGRLSATNDLREAVLRSDLTLVCVGTPSRNDGSLNADFLHRVCCQLGEALRELNAYHVVVIRSTLVPGMTRGYVLPLLEARSGKTAGSDFGLCFNPEFLREGSALEDFFHPSRTVIGEIDPRSGDRVASIYDGLPGPMVRVNFETAELSKYADNCWHALKIAFANEVGSLANAIGIDASAAMSIFALDTKLNISTKYLKPGAPFGGSCLPKDLRAANGLARQLNLNLPLLKSILTSNSEHLDRALQVIRAMGARRVGVLGVTFKPDTDDIRESPSVQLIACLLRDGIDVVVHDKNIVPANLLGVNRSFLMENIPDLAQRLLQDPEELCKSVDIIVVMHSILPYRDLISRYRSLAAVLDYANLAPLEFASTPRVDDAKSADHKLKHAAALGDG